MKTEARIANRVGRSQRQTRVPITIDAVPNGGRSATGCGTFCGYCLPEFKTVAKATGVATR